MRPIAFGEALPAGTRLTLFSDDKPNRFFTVIKFWMDETSGVALALRTGVPSYQVGVPIADGPKTTFSPFSYRILRFYSVTARISSLLKRAGASYAEYRDRKAAR